LGLNFTSPIRSSVERIALDVMETTTMPAMKTEAIFKPSGRSQIFSTVV